MTRIIINHSQARKFLLAYHSLWPPRSLSDKNGVLGYIRRVHCIQFDPLDIVGQNADLVLQSRVSNYKPDMLRELLYKDRQLLDGYDKNMAIYPIEDWPYFNRRRNAAKNELRSAEAVQSIAPQIIQAIAERGPLSSLDLEFDQQVDWFWAPTRLSRAALESLYFSGDLIIHRKNHTRKFYDLASRCIPSDLYNAPEPNRTDNEYQDWYIKRRTGSVGLIWRQGAECWLGVPANSAQRSATMKRLVDQGEVLEVAVESIDTPLYILSRDSYLLGEGNKIDEQRPQMAFIAPLDNLLWNRRLLEELFGFHYRWEVYVPPGKRQYGYYVLPVLYGEHFIARFEPVRNKKGKTLTIKNWWWEPGVSPTLEIIEALKEALVHFASYLEVSDIIFDGHHTDGFDIGWLGQALADLADKHI